MSQVSCYCPGARNKPNLFVHKNHKVTNVTDDITHAGCLLTVSWWNWNVSIFIFDTCISLNLLDYSQICQYPMQVICNDYCICNLSYKVKTWLCGTSVETSANSLTIISVPSLDEWGENCVDRRVILRFIRNLQC